MRVIGSRVNCLRAAVSDWLVTVAVGLVGICSVGLANASPAYSYTFRLTVESGAANCPGGLPSPGTQAGFGCSTGPGTVWDGTFQIALDASSLSDGAYSTPFLQMRLDTGDTHWDHCAFIGSCSIDPSNVLAGYRDLVGPDYFNVSGPGFYVAGGAIIGFSGGFYCCADQAFIDFDYLHSRGAGKFAANGTDSTYVRGTYVISQVPEPATVALVLPAILMIAMARARRASR